MPWGWSTGGCELRTWALGTELGSSVLLTTEPFVLFCFVFAPNSFVSLFNFVFLSQSLTVSQVAPNSSLPLSPECWDYRHPSAHPVLHIARDQIQGFV